jgi:hypothetical protein
LAEQHDAEERRFQQEGGEGFIAEERPWIEPVFCASTFQLVPN